ncbi:MAG: acyl-CoA synthetase [Proteobacteria bacterium]|nr:acyl-CoA synthetase [Pseudomonadota bacterium]
MLHRLIWAGLFIATLLFISPATVMLLFFGLLPSFVALITDRSDGKYAMFCVLGLNFSGLFPFLADLWFKTDSIDAATNILSDVFSLFIIYGAAGFGVMFYMVLPPVVTSLLSVMSQRRVAELRENQAKIVEEWGKGVTKAAEVVVGGGIAAP